MQKPANREEITKTKEGVEFHYLAAPDRITKKNGKINKDVLLMEPVALIMGGRLSPVLLFQLKILSRSLKPIPGIMPIGQKSR